MVLVTAPHKSYRDWFSTRFIPYRCPHFILHLQEEHGSDGRGRGRGRGRGKGQGQRRGRPQFHQNNRGGHSGATMSNVNCGSSGGNAFSNINLNRVGLGQHVFEQSAAAKQSSIPRMPDGTKGFSIGRGKPMAIITTS